MNFWCYFLLVLLIKQDRRTTQKIVKALMEFFHKIKFLTENTINHDITFGVILSTVYGGQNLELGAPPDPTNVPTSLTTFVCSSFDTHSGV